jgi:hypothetical protein
VRFDWSAPVEDGNGGIDSYNIFVQNRDGQFMKLDECGLDPSDLKCIVSLETLENSPFLLTKNHDIVANISAGNSKGQGELSEVDDELEVRMIATIVDAPILNNHEQTENYVKLCWTEVLP